MRYYKTPNANFYHNPKAGTTSVTHAIIAAHYPDVHARVLHAHMPPGRSVEDGLFHAMCPHVDEPTYTSNKPLIALLRDPVERFRSAYAFAPFMGRTFTGVDEVLDLLEQGANLHHFRIQSAGIPPEARLYKFPDHLADVETALDLPAGAITQRNAANAPKPDLTEEQLARVRAYYAPDTAILDTITEPGTVYA